MNMTQIKDVAKERGVKPGRMKKADLIRAIQQSEDNPQCFAIGQLDQCREDGCLWREDCC